MLKQYQVTLFCNTNAYKPVSCIIKHEQIDNSDLTLDTTTRKTITTKGIQKICNQRYWSKKDLQKYGYTRVKAREYSPTATK